MRAGLAIVVLGEEAAQGGPKAERVEHPAGDVLHVGFFDFLVRAVGHIDALGDRRRRSVRPDPFTAARIGWKDG